MKVAVSGRSDRLRSSQKGIPLLAGFCVIPQEPSVKSENDLNTAPEALQSGFGLSLFRKRAEYGFGEYGFKHRAQ